MGEKTFGEKRCSLHAFKLNKYLTCYQPLGDQVIALPLFKNFLITIIIENQQNVKRGIYSKSYK